MGGGSGSEGAEGVALVGFKIVFVGQRDGSWRRFGVGVSGEEAGAEGEDGGGGAKEGGTAGVALREPGGDGGSRAGCPRSGGFPAGELRGDGGSRAGSPRSGWLGSQRNHGRLLSLSV